MSNSKAVTANSVVLEPDEEKNAEIRASQAEYKGNHHMDKVTVKIIKNTKYYKKGQSDTVHPTVAAIMKQKGIIGDYEKDVKTYRAPKVEDGQLKNH
jgi:preprotein translocase subunit SecF